MSFNLPAKRLLKLIKGKWEDVQYPAAVVVKCQLSPKDYFEPVGQDEGRSCIPEGGTGFVWSFNAYNGRMILRGESMFPPLSVEFKINSGVLDISFSGSVLRISQEIQSENDIDSLLTNIEHTLPSLLSVTSGIAIHCESLELCMDGSLVAVSEIFLPPNGVRLVRESSRIEEIKAGIELQGIACSSPRFILASNYYREALYYDSTYHEHNPYTFSLITILKSALAIEILFGCERNSIRDKCRKLEIPEDVIESDIIRIILARNELGSAHSSSFVPNLEETEIIRSFAKRSVEITRQILLHIVSSNTADHAYLFKNFSRNKDKEVLIAKLSESIKKPIWSSSESSEWRCVSVLDPRLS